MTLFATEGNSYPLSIVEEIVILLQLVDIQDLGHHGAPLAIPSGGRDRKHGWATQAKQKCMKFVINRPSLSNYQGAGSKDPKFKSTTF